jgi:hypothetical protein
VFDRVLNFVKSPSALDRVFAGHFQRILESFLAHDFDWIPDLSEFLRSILSFAIAHVDVLAYQQFLWHLPSDFETALSAMEDWACPDPQPEADAVPFVGFFNELLEGAARECFAIRDILGRFPDLGDRLRRVKDRLPERTNRYRPMSRLKKPLPLPPYILNPTEVTTWTAPADYAVRLARRRVGVEAVPADDEAAAQALALARTRAYLLLALLQGVVSEKADFANDILRAPRLLELLFMCGVYADPHSMVAPAAFRILETLRYGNPDLGIPPASSEDAALLARIAAEYAPDIEFTTELTAKMCAAFPLFWNQPIAGAPEVNGGEPIEAELLAPFPPADAPPATFPRWAPTRSTRPTPLVLYGRFLVDDPPLNQAIGVRIVQVLRAYHEDGIKVREDIPAAPITHKDYFAYQKKVLDLDWPFVEFLRAKFPFGVDKTDVDMSILNTVLPLSPMDPYFSNATSERHRVALNGALVEFADFWTSTNFLEFGDGSTSQLQESIPKLDSVAAAEVLVYSRLYKDVDAVAKGRDPPRDAPQEGDNWPEPKDQLKKFGRSSSQGTIAPGH